MRAQKKKMEKLLPMAEGYFALLHLGNTIEEAVNTSLDVMNYINLKECITGAI